MDGSYRMIFAAERMRESAESGIEFTRNSMRCDGFAVEVEGDGAIEVGAEDADVGGLEFLEHFRAGMAVAIAETAGDDGPPRGDAGEECGTGGGEATVMTDFEQRALKT